MTRSARLDPTHAGDLVPRWAQFAQDARRAHAPPTGDLAVVMPAEVLAGILPPVIGFRCSGVSRLRRISPEAGTRVAAPGVTIHDDGYAPLGPELRSDRRRRYPHGATCAHSGRRSVRATL